MTHKPRSHSAPAHRRRLSLEQLESRHMLTAVPFGPEQLIDTNEATDTLIIMADLDGDGDLDQLAADDGVFWYENTDGAGTFGSAQTIATAAQANNVRGLDVGDVDRDGDLDVFASSVSDDKVQWFENFGPNFFSSPKLIFSHSSVGASVKLVDDDGDGDLDVLFDGNVGRYENNGSGGFTPSGSGLSADYITTTDSNQGGQLYIITADLSANTITLDAGGTTASVPLNAPRNLTAADLDGDGFTDVIATSGTDGDLVWYNNHGTTGNFFQGNPFKKTIDSGLTGAYDVTVGDLDADGDLDLLASGRSGSGTIAWYENGGESDPTFTRHVLEMPPTAEDVAIGDIDNDGDLDVSYVSSNNNRRVWRANLAIHSGITINSQAEVTIDGIFFGAVSVTTADIDGDGDLDVLGAAFAADDITWWENTVGDGSAWAEHTIDGSFNGAASVRTADVDGDGDLDVLGAAFAADDITWWENTASDGSAWTEHTIDGSFDGSTSVTTADVDGDGDLDVLGAAVLADDITWWENIASDGSAWTEHTIDGSFDGSTSVTTADVDGDGDLDVLGAAVRANDITWWENRRAQFSLNTSDTAPAQILPGDESELLKIDFTHLGRSGDAAAQLESVQLRIETSSGTALTTAEANAVIDRLVLYRDDDDNGVFNAPIDTAISSVDNLTLTNGLLSLSLPSGVGTVAVLAATTRSYLVVAEFPTNAGAAPETSFRLVHQTTGATTTSATYFDQTDPLLSLPQANVTSSTVTVAPLLATSITRLDPTPTNAGSVSYSVVFDRDAIGVSVDDFSLTTTGDVAGNVSQVVQGTPSSYTVTVDNITGTGTLRLDLEDDDTIVDPNGNPLGNFGVGNGDFEGEVYMIDNMLPQVLSIVRLDEISFPPFFLTFWVTFNKSVTGVDVTDFQIATTGTATGTILRVDEQQPFSYLVDIENIAGAGTLGLNLIDDDSIFDTVDPTPLPLGGVGTGNGDATGQVFTLPAGDFDTDDDVDGFDFLTWQRGFGVTSGATVADGDANNDGAVNGFDLALWKTNYGQTQSIVAAASSPSTEEPIADRSELIDAALEMALHDIDNRVEAIVPRQVPPILTEVRQLESAVRHFVSFSDDTPVETLSQQADDRSPEGPQEWLSEELLESVFAEK
ncbi:MAG: FG-GAP-like repeat-containing protein [Lacipirellulaceae bacterium]